MRIVVVGAGIAGLTVAAHARRTGHDVRIIEKRPGFVESGYGLGLYRPGSKVLEGLGLYADFLASGREIKRYAVYGATGETIQSVDLSEADDAINPFVMIERTRLIEILASACRDCTFSWSTTVDHASQTAREVSLELSDGTRVEADLVVNATGRSGARLWSGGRRTVHTPWIYWTWWGENGVADEQALADFAGPGFFLGVYPVPGRSMYALCMPRGSTDATSSTEEVRAAARTALADLIMARPTLGTVIDDATGFYQWPMDDATRGSWFDGRIVMCGDAAASSIPTAGLGASHALNEAICLIEALESLDVGTALTTALLEYERRCRGKVHSSLRSSRIVARIMLRPGKVGSRVRNSVLSRYPADKVIDSLTASVLQKY